MPTPGQELATIDFASMIGGPLVAVVNAQSQAALSSANFIKTVGFEPPGKDANGNPTPGAPIYVSFKYPKEIAPFTPAADVVDTITVTASGSGYTSNPSVTITGGGGSGATATPTLGGGTVTSIAVSSPGTGYTAAPTVTITGGGGTGATATATVAGGAVTGISVTNAGTGYTSAPSVALTGGGGGSGAAATASVGYGVTSISVSNGGTGYTSAPTVTITGGGGTGATATATTKHTNAYPAQIQEMQLDVPILTILPIPFIRIDETTVDFHAKINSVEFSKTDTSLGVKGDLTVQQGWPGGSAKLNVSVSYQRNTTQGSKVDRTYSMDIHVKAVQEELPEGLDRILGILEKAMREQPVNAPAPQLTQ